MASNPNGNLESVVGSFFFGEVNEPLVFPYPHFSDAQVEMAKEMTSAVDQFAKDNIDGEKFEREAHLPKEVIQGVAEMGLLGLGVPEDLGGLGLDYSLYCRVFAQIAAYDGSVATMMGAHQSIGYRALLNEGNPEQKKKWLPKLASGQVIAAFCLTEPGSGSDAYSIKTKAVDNKDGTYTITGQKLWITNGGLAGFYSVFCKTDHEIEGKNVEKISCFIVEGGSPGLSFGEKENKMGIRASETRAVYFDKVVVPKENILGELGKGFKIAMNVLNSGRLSLGAGCVSGMKMIIEMATNHAANRKQFDRPIAEFGLIQDKLTKMAAMAYASESIVYLTTGNMIKGMNDYYMETAVCKIYGSESLWSCIDMAMQIAAGNGYMKEYPYERIMRDVRINMIFEGTNEILRALLALSGVRGPSEEMKELGKITDVSKALQDPIKSLGVFTKFARKRMSNMMGSKTLAAKVHPELKEQAEKFSSMLGKFAIAVEDTLMKYGKKIIDNELPQGRLADMVIDLYIIVAVISRTTAILNGSKATVEQKEHALRLTKYICNDSGRKIRRNLKAMSKNNDKSVAKISAQIVKAGGYEFDIIDF
ncbi:MAG: acyl-CoA dehydrogenase family protein [Bdellovibrionales bacterium]|nr:acyl-CoA dehydrogenase family protein [Bdellovibrionales bacterium]